MDAQTIASKPDTNHGNLQGFPCSLLAILRASTVATKEAAPLPCRARPGAGHRRVRSARVRHSPAADSEASDEADLEKPGVSGPRFGNDVLRVELFQQWCINKLRLIWSGLDVLLGFCRMTVACASGKQHIFLECPKTNPGLWARPRSSFLNGSGAGAAGGGQRCCAHSVGCWMPT